MPAKQLGFQKRKLKKPRYFVDVFYTAYKTKTEGLELSETIYGPAQCKIESRRVGETVHKRNYTKGWVFLVQRGGEGGRFCSCDGDFGIGSIICRSSGRAHLQLSQTLESADTG